MRLLKIKSYAKINLSLNIIKKIPKKHHLIESLVTFINFYDLIYIRETKTLKHKIKFLGKFSKNISKNNSVNKLLNLLDEKDLLKGRKFEIKIIKNIPQKSGMGGGSMNASTLAKFFLKRKIINLSKKNMCNILKSIGSDVPLGMNFKNTVMSKTGKLTIKEKKIGLYTLIVKPNFGCSTKIIYSKNKEQTKPKYNNPKSSLFTIKNITNSKNDLEKAAFKLNPKLKNLKLFLSSLPNTMCVRMTGSGSCLVAYYQSKKKALKGLGLFKKKYKNYWCIVSKTV
ncbi:MAG: 4-(cytidine 5'-diphospho)-2-C-methyl-D-erythritol kinase [Pelagibacteraceae bacterium TMED268]|nr:MAG: 4-(cytidine 5'-diphospho)-2-C-methyl-D-erythritol kinase [Pelagibacteraceae bacterium TMED268]